MKALLFLPLALVGHATADEAADKAAEELATAYKKTGGFIANYHSETSKRAVDAVIAFDMASGLTASETRMFLEGAPNATVRFWNNSQDEVFLCKDDTTLKVKGVTAELKFLNSLTNTVLFEWQADDGSGEPPADEGDPSPIASILLQRETISPGFNISTSLLKPCWRDLVKEATIKESDARTVTFETKDSGLLKISRENGLMVEQSIANEAGVVRRLVLRGEVSLNPGKDRVKALSADWSTTTPQTKGAGFLTSAFRTGVFQLMVKHAQDGTIDLSKMEQRLKERQDDLRKLASGWAKDGDLIHNPIWKALFDNCREAVHTQWLKQLPNDGKGADDSAFEAYLGTAECRRQFRDAIAELATHNDTSKKMVLDEVFQPPLAAANEAGESAKTLVESAMIRAYFEAIIEQKTSDYWGERKGLD